MKISFSYSFKKYDVFTGEHFVWEKRLYLINIKFLKDLRNRQNQSNESKDNWIIIYWNDLSYIS